MYLLRKMLKTFRELQARALADAARAWRVLDLPVYHEQTGAAHAYGLAADSCLEAVKLLQARHNTEPARAALAESRAAKGDQS